MPFTFIKVGGLQTESWLVLYYLKTGEGKRRKIEFVCTYVQKWRKWKTATNFRLDILFLLFPIHFEIYIFRTIILASTRIKYEYFDC